MAALVDLDALFSAANSSGPVECVILEIQRQLVTVDLRVRLAYDAQQQYAYDVTVCGNTKDGVCKARQCVHDVPTVLHRRCVARFAFIFGADLILLLNGSAPAPAGGRPAASTTECPPRDRHSATWAAHSSICAHASPEPFARFSEERACRGAAAAPGLRT